MDETLWTSVDQYFADLLVPPDSTLDEALRANAEAGLPSIDVSPSFGKLLHLLASIRGAKSILEIGTLGGYSTIWLARALPPDGRLITLEAEPAHAKVALENIARAGLGDHVQLRLGLALDTLPVLAGEGLGPFDMIFIDADKKSNPDYFEWALKLSRVGTLIVIDNVVRKGAVLDTASDDPNIQGVRRLARMIADNPRVSASAIQTVGSKGYDGFAMVLVTGSA